MAMHRYLSELEDGGPVRPFDGGKPRCAYLFPVAKWRDKVQVCAAPAPSMYAHHLPLCKEHQPRRQAAKRLAKLTTKTKDAWKAATRLKSSLAEANREREGLSKEVARLRYRVRYLQGLTLKRSKSVTELTWCVSQMWKEATERLLEAEAEQREATAACRRTPTRGALRRSPRRLKRPYPSQGGCSQAKPQPASPRTSRRTRKL